MWDKLLCVYYIMKFYLWLYCAEALSLSLSLSMDVLVICKSAVVQDIKKFEGNKEKEETV